MEFVNETSSGEVLRRCRESAGFGLRAGGRAVSLAPVTLSRMESGDIPVTGNPETVKRIIGAFKINRLDAEVIFAVPMERAKNAYLELMSAVGCASGVVE